MSYECPPVDVTSCLDWQRSKAEKVQEFVANDQAFIDENHCDFWEGWFESTFNVDTCDEFGLSVYSIIFEEDLWFLGSNIPANTFGFNLYESNFDNGNFGTVGTLIPRELPIEYKRIIIKLKAYKTLAMGFDMIKNNASMGYTIGKDPIADRPLVSFSDNLDGSYSLWSSALVDQELIDLILLKELFPLPAGMRIRNIIRA